MSEHALPTDAIAERSTMLDTTSTSAAVIRRPAAATVSKSGSIANVTASNRM